MNERADREVDGRTGRASPVLLFGLSGKCFMSYQPRPFASTKLCPLFSPSIFPLHVCLLILSSLSLAASFQPPSSFFTLSPPPFYLSFTRFLSCSYRLSILPVAFCLHSDLLLHLSSAVSCSRHTPTHLQFFSIFTFSPASYPLVLLFLSSS